MKRTLTARQLELLHRIVNDGHRPVSSEATSTYALRSRGLVITDGMYGYFSAVPTEAGRVVAGGLSPREVSGSMSGSRQAVTERSRQAAAAKAVPMSGDAFVAQLLTDGRIVVASPSTDERAEWRRLLFAAQGHRAIPSGLAVRRTGRDSGDLVVWLEAATEASTPAAIRPIEIPDTVRRPHPLIGALRAAKAADGWIDTRQAVGVAHVRVHRSSIPRAVRLLHALCAEAVRRGYTIDTRPNHGCKGGLWIGIQGDWLELVMTEETTRVPHELSASERTRRDAGRGWGIPEYDHLPSGRLVIKDGHGSYASTLANDRQRWRIEDRLGFALASLEERAEQAEQRRLDEARKQANAQRRWETAMDAARRRYEEDRRIRHLTEIVDRHESARRIRALLASPAISSDAALGEWLRWAGEHADSVDPAIAGVQLPAIPQPRPEDLTPFLDGLSPYGPSGSRWH